MTGRTGDPGEWRRLAEARLAAFEPADPGAADLRGVLHELRVHQVELELQNEALEEARLTAEAGWERFQELYDSSPAGHFSVDRQGRILEANLAGARLLGEDRTALTGRRFAGFLGGADRAAFAAFLARGLDGLDPPPCEVTLQGGRPAGVPVRLQGASSADGKVLQMAALDITEQRLAVEQARLARHDLLQRVEELRAQLEAAKAELDLLRRRLAARES